MTWHHQQANAVGTKTKLIGVVGVAIAVCLVVASHTASSDKSSLVVSVPHKAGTVSTTSRSVDAVKMVPGVQHLKQNSGARPLRNQATRSTHQGSTGTNLATSREEERNEPAAPEQSPGTFGISRPWSVGGAILVALGAAIYGITARAFPRTQRWSMDDGEDVETPHAGAVVAAATVAISTAMAASPIVPPALAAKGYDTIATGKCVISKCQLELARCLADEKCLENLVCLNAVGNDPAGQMRCGDLYASTKAVQSFNTCAVSAQKCVPQTSTSNYPIPKDDATVPELSTKSLEGRWYIVAGENKLFDAFPCQEHYFTAPEEGKLYAKIQWRTEKANGQFYERSDIQTFVQDPDKPGVLYNHDNEYLHYQDDWYIVDKNDDYFFVYYRGSNDAWDGYGGAVVYARENTLNEEWRPQLEETAKTVGLDFNKFVITDNSCGPEPPLRVVVPTDADILADDFVALEQQAAKGVIGLEKELEKDITGLEKELEKDIVGLEKTLVTDMEAAEKNLEDSLVSFGPRFTVLKSELLGTDQSKQQQRPLTAEEKANRKELRQAEKDLAKMEASYNEPSGIFGIFSKIFGN